MPKFRKKPVEIEAVQITEITDQGINTNCDDAPWLAEAISKDRSEVGSVSLYRDGLDGAIYVSIHTLEGDHRAGVSDWIIRGVKGELYPCKPDIFAATYDAA